MNRRQRSQRLKIGTQIYELLELQDLEFGEVEMLPGKWFRVARTTVEENELF
jgi:hypothetical protein